MSEQIVWWPPTPEHVGAGTRVAVVTVNHNTKELTAFLLYSLRKVLRWPTLDDVVIVDNGSTDGSRELLSEVTAAGLCTLVANDENRYHGPALNQALSHLARQVEVTGQGPDWVWILDSDCVIARPDALLQATEAARMAAAALVGEYRWDRWHGVERFGVHCLLLNPRIVWCDRVRAFEDGGDPAFEFLQSANRAGLVSVPFPFLSDGYVIHRGRGTLNRLVINEDRSNRYYDWAANHHEPHFDNVPGAASHYDVLMKAFQVAVPNGTAAELIAACAGL